ncbi:hypothetical protein J6590_093177 [Homalodisca vitripennis]|nr:hypothetical protein J6590_093177 [Homalodisca vitripennis]
MDPSALWPILINPVAGLFGVVADCIVKEREILKVTTGVSEYEGRIGALAELILQDELHGTPQDVQCLRFQEMMKLRGAK